MGYTRSGVLPDSDALLEIAEVLDAGCEVEEFAWSARLVERPEGEVLLGRLRDHRSEKSRHRLGRLR